MYLVDASLKCNFEDRPCGPCKYCYNTSARRAIQDKEKINFDAIEASLRKEYAKRPKPIVLHGGEPLFIDNETLERLLKLSFELSGKSSIQTNGSLVDDKKIELFKKYKTSIGISIDGFWPANEWRGGTKEMTDLVIKNIFKLKEVGLNPGIIITLHKGNANEKNIKYIEDFILEMSKAGIHGGKINPIIHPDSNIQLTPQELKWAYLRLVEFVLDNNIRGWGPFSFIVNNLSKNQLADCIFTNCDPFCTDSATVITSDGTLTFCKKFQTEVFIRDSKPLYTRWEILQQTDCKDCRYGGKICFGGCPAASKDFDWRNKTRWCEAYKALYEFLENKMKTLCPKVPLITDTNTQGNCRTNLPRENGGYGDAPHGDHSEHGDGLVHRDNPQGNCGTNLPRKNGGHGDVAHGDHSDSVPPHLRENYQNREHGDAPHGDAVHGDHSEHGDALLSPQLNSKQ